ncbi:MAG: protein kinase [Vicinamibacterales bacterium]
MPITPGTSLGSYEVLNKVGEGGMGEVYRAHDSRLHRDVAIKVLPELFALDPDRLTRFEREAQVLASLNHPNIATVYGVERAGGIHALVMELVEGDDLSQRIARGPIPLDEALPIARQIADGLEAAHERGIIHRDLKPANIKVRDDGTVKVLDFGLAKATAAPVGASLTGGGPQHSPTFTSPAMTQMGMILGTAAYMAPEQAKGRVVDRRADIWAFGCVVYEMLTAKRAFPGEDITDTLAAIVRAEPDWTALPAATPASLRRLLRRCLEKDARQRLSSMGDARLDLNEREDPQTTAPAGSLRRSIPMSALAGSVVAGAAVAAGIFVVAGGTFNYAPARPTTRLILLSPTGTNFSFDSSEVALSPDGRFVAFATGTTQGRGSTRLWIRPIDSLEARELPGTEGGHLPFWSPESDEIGYFSADKMKKVSITGGIPQDICEAQDGRGGTWSREGGIVFAPLNNGALAHVSPNGGAVTPATVLDEASGEIGHRFPKFLPDGRSFMFALVPPRSASMRYQILVASLDSKERKVLLESAGVPVYAHPGYLLFARANNLVAQRFDPRTNTLSGEAQSLGDAVSSLQALFSAGSAVSVSSAGAFIYLGGPIVNTKVLSFDRSGRQQPDIELPEGHYNELVISPDGTRLALVRKNSTLESDVWLAELSRAGASRFTFGNALNYGPTWSNDGARIAFASDLTGPWNILVRSSNGASPAETFFQSTIPYKDPKHFSPDGRFLLMSQLNPRNKRDLLMLPLDGERTPRPYVASAFDETEGRISPDGRWAGYISDESGRYETYIQSFPAPGTKYQVTSQGSHQWVRWRNDGKEIATTDSLARELLVADVQPGAQLRVGTPRRLMALPRNAVALDISPDFQRVLVSVPADGAASNIVVVTDWLSGLTKNRQ